MPSSRRRPGPTLQPSPKRVGGSRPRRDDGTHTERTEAIPARPMREKDRAFLPCCACGGGGLAVRVARRLGAGITINESVALARRYTDRHLYLAVDRPGGAELAARLRGRQPLQPRRLGDRRFPLSGDRAGIASDPELSAEFRRYRYLAGDPDSDPYVPAEADHLRSCPVPHLLRRHLPQSSTAYACKSA